MFNIFNQNKSNEIIYSLIIEPKPIIIYNDLLLYKHNHKQEELINLKEKTYCNFNLNDKDKNIVIINNSNKYDINDNIDSILKIFNLFYKLNIFNKNILDICQENLGNLESLLNDKNIEHLKKILDKNYFYNQKEKKIHIIHDLKTILYDDKYYNNFLYCNIYIKVRNNILERYLVSNSSNDIYFIKNNDKILNLEFLQIKITIDSGEELKIIMCLDFDNESIAKLGYDNNKSKYKLLLLLNIVLYKYIIEKKNNFKAKLKNIKKEYNTTYTDIITKNDYIAIYNNKIIGDINYYIGYNTYDDLKKYFLFDEKQDIQINNLNILKFINLINKDNIDINILYNYDIPLYLDEQFTYELITKIDNSLPLDNSIIVQYKMLNIILPSEEYDIYLYYTHYNRDLYINNELEFYKIDNDYYSESYNTYYNSYDKNILLFKIKYNDTETNYLFNFNNNQLVLKNLFKKCIDDYNKNKDEYNKNQKLYIECKKKHILYTENKITEVQKLQNKNIEEKIEKLLDIMRIYTYKLYDNKIINLDCTILNHKSDYNDTNIILQKLKENIIENLLDNSKAANESDLLNKYKSYFYKKYKYSLESFLTVWDDNTTDTVNSVIETFIEKNKTKLNKKHYTYKTEYANNITTRLFKLYIFMIEYSFFKILKILNLNISDYLVNLYEHDSINNVNKLTLPDIYTLTDILNKIKNDLIKTNLINTKSIQIIINYIIKYIAKHNFNIFNDLCQKYNKNTLNIFINKENKEYNLHKKFNILLEQNKDYDRSILIYLLDIIKKNEIPNSTRHTELLIKYNISTKLYDLYKNIINHINSRETIEYKFYNLSNSYTQSIIINNHLYNEINTNNNELQFLKYIDNLKLDIKDNNDFIKSLSESTDEYNKFKNENYIPNLIKSVLINNIMYINNGISNFYRCLYNNSSKYYNQYLHSEKFKKIIELLEVITLNRRYEYNINKSLNLHLYKEYLYEYLYKYNGIRIILYAIAKSRFTANYLIPIEDLPINTLKPEKKGGSSKQYQLYISKNNRYFIIYNNKKLYLTKKNTYIKKNNLFLRINNRLNLKIKI